MPEQKSKELDQIVELAPDEIRPGVLRTPDARFEELPEFPYAPHYVDIPDKTFGQLRMHYIDEGPRDGRIVLMIHGNPTWSYLYRHTLGPVVDAGYRVIAPDLIGYGRSDKPYTPGAYSYDSIIGWLFEFLKQLDLRGITLVCQDWGGLTGLRAVAEYPDWFDAVVAANTLLPNNEPPPRGVAVWPGEAIGNYWEFCRTHDDADVGGLVQSVTVEPMSNAVRAAYDAPFPDPRFKAAVFQYTCVIAQGYTENEAAWRKLERWTKPFVTAFSDCDPSTAPWVEVFHHRIPGTKGFEHPTIPNAGHFLQEERGEALARVIVDLQAKL